MYLAGWALELGFAKSALLRTADTGADRSIR